MNLHVIAIDYYGHGYTPISTKDLSIYHVADDIKFLLDSMKIKKAIIGGWSRGGTISSAFYNAYPETVQALILEDGGSVAWDFQTKAANIEKDIEETKQYYTNKKTMVFDTDFDAYWFMYNNWGIKGKNNEKLKKEIFTSYARIKKNANGKYEINPGAEELTGENSAEENIAIIYTPFTGILKKEVTVLEILYQMGFNSKSSFNTSFKKYTGKIPTELKKMQGNTSFF